MFEKNDYSECYGVCDQCGDKLVPVKFCSNPFVKEVCSEEDNPQENWCEDCYNNAFMDI